MRGPHRTPRVLILASMALATVMGCSYTSVCNGQGPGTNSDGQPANAAGYKRYETWSKLMGYEVEPFIFAAVDELNKDPQDTDFKMLAAWCRKVAYYYGCGHDKRSDLYFGDGAEELRFAKKTQAWFLEMAKTADAKDQLKLVRLLNKREQHCNQCHEWSG